MKTIQFLRVPTIWRTLALSTATALLSTTLAQAATTNIEVWTSLNQHNKQAFEKLVKAFNADQKEVSVKSKSFDSSDAIESALAGGAKSAAGPNLVQLDDDRDPDTVAKKRSYVLPLYTLLAKHPISNAAWFLPADNPFLRDSRARLLAFPYMVEVPVMYYNIDAFKKAGISPAAPARSWKSLQDQVVQLANNGSRQCPFTTDVPVSVNLENLAAVNNQLYATDDNGLAAKGKTTPRFSFDSLFVRHLSVMISWVRSEIMTRPDQESKATSRFANRECAVLLSSSSNMGWFNDSRSLNFGVTGLPYYPDVAPTPGNPFVNGAALWAIKGHTADQDKATAAFLSWLAQPKNASTWYQQTGFLPLTQQAFAATGDSYYKNLGAWKSLVAVYAKRPSSTALGFRISNYPQIKAMFHKTLDRALSGQLPAVSALNSASAQASSMMGPSSGVASGSSKAVHHSSKAKKTHKKQ